MTLARPLTGRRARGMPKGLTAGSAENEDHIANYRRGVTGRSPVEGVAEKPEALERGGDFPLLIIYGNIKRLLYY